MLEIEMLDMNIYTFIERSLLSEEYLMINTCIIEAKSRYKTEDLLTARFFADKNISLTRDIASEIIECLNSI